MNVVDSSGWLEYFSDSPNASFFMPAIEDQPELLIPVIIINEVFKRVLQQRGEQEALEVIAAMMQARVVELDAATALTAARLSNELKLPMAGSIILATARIYEAVLWTQDADLAAIDGVRYIARRRNGAAS